jgi:hypothetical protein
MFWKLNFEKPQPAQSESLDEKWYKKFEKFGSFQVYEYLVGDKQYREEQKREFINGEIENPVLDYPKIDQEKLARDEKELLGLKKDILEKEENEVIRKLYRWKINEKIAELRMLKAAGTGDDKRFSRYSEYIYGKPSPEVFAYTIKSLKKIIAGDKNSNDRQVAKAAEELDRLLPLDFSKDPIKELPSKDNVNRVRTEVLHEMGDLLNTGLLVKEGKYSAEEIRDVFQGALEKLQAKEWQVIVDVSSKTGISVDQEKKSIKIPESRELTLNKLQKLIAHEVGTHVAKRIKGEKSQLHLLGLGLDRYEKGEEGVATMREQALDDKFSDFSGLTGHLAISLAYGLDGKPRNFRGVYEILEKYFYLKELKEGKQSEESLALAQNSAWNKTVRTFRGTSCNTPGVCFTEDIVYREGNIGVWNVIKKTPDELFRFSVGKYDPANSRHIWILNQLGISEEDLKRDK